MVLPRSPALRGSIRSLTLKRATTQARTAVRGIGRRGYASEHGVKKSSDIPWLIGSLVFTVPAAGWLLQQGPTKSDHGHGHGHAHDAHDAHEEKTEETSAEEASEESKGDEAAAQEDSQGDSKGDSKDEAKDEAKDEKDDKDEKDKKEEKEDENKDAEEGKEEGSSDEASAGSSAGKKRGSETKGEKDAQKDSSGAKHPAIDDPAKSKKSEGVAETAKIHGTVDSSRPTKGQKDAGKSKDDD